MYQIDQKTAQAAIDQSGHVCGYCGGKLEPIETVDNAQNPTFWIGCMACIRFTTGCKPEAFSIAKKMVEEHNFYYYKLEGSWHDYKSEGSWHDENNKKCNINKAAELIQLIEYLKANP